MVWLGLGLEGKYATEIYRHTALNLLNYTRNDVCVKILFAVLLLFFLRLSLWTPRKNQLEKDTTGIAVSQKLTQALS